MLRVELTHDIDWSNVGVRSVPAVVVDGNLAACCVNRGPEESAIREAGLGQPPP